jgi:DNA-binding beta-propeller fold protein YncE
MAAGRALRRPRAALAAAVAIAFAAGLAASGPAAAAPLTEVGSIPLGPVAGPINGLAMDYANQRLFVLEGAAGKLVAIDLNAGTVSQTIDGLKEPAGLARDPQDDRLYVATGDGKLAVYQGVPLKPAPDLAVGSDLEAPQYDAGSERVYLGYEKRRIAIIDTTHDKLWESIHLDGAPGPLALEDGGSRMFIGAAGDKRILVADRDGNKQTGSWESGDNADPAALALDEDAGRLLAAFRQPAVLAWLALDDGSVKGSVEACATPGALLADSGRGRVYLACGEGRIEVFQRAAGGSYAKAGAIDTVPGATAALLVPTSGRLYLAAPAAGGHAAEVRIYAPAS